MTSFAERQLALLGDADPMDVLPRTPNRLSEVVARLGESKLSRPREKGKWSARQVLAHLTDMEIVFGYRFRQTLAEQPHALQGVDQDAWARGYSGADPELALGAFRGLRLWNVGLLRSLTRTELGRCYLHPERGEETLDRLLHIWAGHDLNHLSQMEASLAL
jgi:uncharacterized damage-inducible protein DinB